MCDRRHKGVLSQDLHWQDWASILDLGRHVISDSQSWLETYSNQNERTAIFLSGCVGLRPISDEVDDGRDIILRAAPAIIELPGTDEVSEGHWIVEKASIYFYSAGGLRETFAKSAQFASNFVQILQGQNAVALTSLYNSDGGLKRLITSLLVRLNGNGVVGEKVFVTQAQLASETGLSRQWVNRLLKQLEYQGIAKLGRGHVFLHAPSKLQLQIC